MKRIFLSIVVAALVFCIGFGLVSVFNSEKNGYKYDSSWIKTTATLTQCAQSKTRSKMSYSYNGINYDNIPSYYSIDVVGNQVGEKYNILLNPKHPGIYVPVDWQPVFADDEEKAITSGVIVAIHRKYAVSQGSYFSDYYIIYDYTIGNNRHERGQVLPPDYEQRYPLIRKEAFFEVNYSVKNEARAITLFDKPLR